MTIVQVGDMFEVRSGYKLAMIVAVASTREEAEAICARNESDEPMIRNAPRAPDLQWSTAERHRARSAQYRPSAIATAFTEASKD